MRPVATVAIFECLRVIVPRHCTDRIQTVIGNCVEDGVRAVNCFEGGRSEPILPANVMSTPVTRDGPGLLGAIRASGTNTGEMHEREYCQEGTRHNYARRWLR